MLRKYIFKLTKNLTFGLFAMVIFTAWISSVSAQAVSCPSNNKEVGDASVILPPLIADMKKLGFSTVWLEDLLAAAPTLEFHTIKVGGGPQFSRPAFGCDAEVHLPPSVFKQDLYGTWILRPLLDSYQYLSFRDGSVKHVSTKADSIATIIEELFHAWLFLVEGGGSQSTFDALSISEGDEELMSEYVNSLIEGYLEMYGMPEEEIERRWNGSTGIVETAVKTANAQRTIELPKTSTYRNTTIFTAYKIPATDYKLAPYQRDFIENNLGLEQRPPSYEELTEDNFGALLYTPIPSLK